MDDKIKVLIINFSLIDTPKYFRDFSGLPEEPYFSMTLVFP